MNPLPSRAVAQPARRSFLAASLVVAPVALGVAASLRSGKVLAAVDPVYTTVFSDKALGGHDAVAYHTEQQAVEGSTSHQTTWQDATWLFTSAENRDRFVAEPERYAPAYGGYCAYAMAQGETAKGDPRHWTLVDDRLYVNYDGDVKALWRKDTSGYIAQADIEWPALLKA